MRIEKRLMTPQGEESDYESDADESATAQDRSLNSPIFTGKKTDQND